jgi:hypothetical protein
VYGNLHLYDIVYEIIVYANSNRGTWPGIDSVLVPYPSTEEVRGTTFYLKYNEQYPRMPHPMDKSGQYMFLNWMISGITEADKNRMLTHYIADWNLYESASDADTCFHPVAGVYETSDDNGSFVSYAITKTTPP